MFSHLLPMRLWLFIFSEIMLKMITDDRYCGRIIGKEGKMIKKIREDTSTKITVSK